MAGNQTGQLVAIDLMTIGVDDDAPVGIAIESYSDIGPIALHGRLERVGIRRPHFPVDLEAIRRHADREYLCAQFVEGTGRHHSSLDRYFP